MLHQELKDITYTCPNCGNKLARDHDLLRCENHGAFFTYGPQLLVRAPRTNAKRSDTLLPWENHSTRGVR
jgi:hypothetical protein